LDGPFTERIADVKGGYAAAQRSQTLDVRDAFGTHNPSDQGRPGESCQPSPEHPSALSPVYTTSPAMTMLKEGCPVSLRSPIGAGNRR